MRRGQRLDRRLDPIGWRRFCRISLDQPVPHPTTLVKLVRRAGPETPETIEQLNGMLRGKLADAKLLRGAQAARGLHRGRGRHRLPNRR